MRTIDLLKSMQPEIVISSEGVMYPVANYNILDTIHTDDTVRRIIYTGNKIMEGKTYATFNVIPKSSSELNAHVAISI